MIATYYAIREYNELTHQVGGIITEGIIKTPEDSIYPGQETGIPELPYECEAHHFRANGYTIEITKFVINRDIVKQNRINGSKLTN